MYFCHNKENNKNKEQTGKNKEQQGGGLAEVQVLAELLEDAKPRASARGPKQKEAKAQNAPEKKARAEGR